MANERLKGYVEVKDRIKMFHESEQHKGWYYLTSIIDNVRPKDIVLSDGMVSSEGGYVQMKCEVFNEKSELRATGYAQEIEGKGMVNKTSYLENCETSAVGRALGMLGFGIDESIASAEEIERIKARKVPMYEVFADISITEEEAKKIVMTTISELAQKLGARKEDIGDMYASKTMGGKSKDASLKQLLNLEKELRTANNESSEWFSIYGMNSRIKNPTPKNQEIVFTSSYVRFGLKALELTEDEDTRFSIIEYYQNTGYDLTEHIKK